MSQAAAHLASREEVYKTEGLIGRSVRVRKLLAKEKDSSRGGSLQGEKVKCLLM